MNKAIILDCFGVLTADKWMEFVSTIPDSQRQPARDINHAYDSGFMDEAEFIEQIVKLTGRNPGEVEASHDTTLDRNKNTALLNYVKGLKSKYKIGLLSNVASTWIQDEFLTKDELAIFDSTTLSYEVHLAKPDPKIFEIACERLGAKFSEAVLVDDIERYCEAARALGMKAIVYQDFEQTKRELERILGE